MEGDIYLVQNHKFRIISIHSLRMEGDKPHSGTLFPLIAFQSTPSAWRETRGDVFFADFGTFQSTPSAWRETGVKRNERNRRIISIHSLRMEGDMRRRMGNGTVSISIHSLRMEGDGIRKKRQRNPSISIHSLRMEGDVRDRYLCITHCISIHSLRMEGDHCRHV